ncbi:MAG: hypothetical protein DCC67_06790 [Planctomycetota bacterium]|nr:MAG: hypothetical protein DCC67_06790 [Planctomycetota bacterium]
MKISSDTTDPDMDGDSPTGVAPAAQLHSIGFNPIGPDFDEEAAISTQHIITAAGGIRAINMSFHNGQTTPVLDGNQHLTQFADWSASLHNILYVVAGNEVPLVTYVPTETFNGMTIAASDLESGVYARVWANNDYTHDAEFNRRSISLLAPGAQVKLTDLGSAPTTAPHPAGTSIAAPHVTATAALLHQYAAERIMNAASPQWNVNANAHRHEVMKAVLMNSADKILDDGMFMLDGNPIPRGNLLGMERTVVKQDGTSTWFDSDAYHDDITEQGGFWPTDEEMGTGHLNASRALTQFRAGEFESSLTVDVPAIGWDYGTTTGMDDVNRYRIAPILRGGSFISVTLAWDRVVTVDNEAGTASVYDIGDTYDEFVDDGINPLGDSVINNMRLWVAPKGAAPSQRIATSDANEGTVQHSFFQLPETGEYEFWVEQVDEDVGTNQNYAVAWWTASASGFGDFNGDGMTDAADLLQWAGDFGQNADSDGDGDGDTDGNDFLFWQRHLGTTAPITAVPEPSAWLICLFAVGSLKLCQSRGSVNRTVGSTLAIVALASAWMDQCNAQSSGESRAMGEIPLSVVVTTSRQDGLKYAREALAKDNPYLRQILENARGGASNAFLVDATTVDDAVRASAGVFVALRAADTPAPVNVTKPIRGSHWLVAYLGSGPSTPTWWTIAGASVEGKTIRLTYRQSPPVPATSDVQHYYYWLPLGKLDPETYEVELFDADEKAVTLMRRVKVEAKK